MQQHLQKQDNVGDDVENVLVRLIQACNYDIPNAERGYNLYR